MKRFISLVATILCIALLTPASMTLALSEGKTVSSTEKTDNDHSNNRHYFDPVVFTVNTGRGNGFSGQDEIDSDDPHSGWQLGRFFIEGFTDTVEVDGQLIFLKNEGDELRFGYILEQDIDELDGDSTMYIHDSSGNEDAVLQTPNQDFEHGALFVKKTDYQGYSEFPIEYLNYLEACEVGAETEITMFEEGDYQVALDYEIKDVRRIFGHTSVFGHSIMPKYYAYRYAFDFQVRNSECMVYPFELETNSEIHDGALTPNGFRLDLARSRYLTIDVEYYELIGGRPTIRDNDRADDGDVYDDPGMYIITVKNGATGSSTVVTIFVGDSSEIMAYHDVFIGQTSIYAPVPTPVDSSDESSDADADESQEYEEEDPVDKMEQWLGSVKMSDPSLRQYVEDNVYRQLMDELDEDYTIECIQSSYISERYISQLTYNSRQNVYFGFTTEELDEYFGDTRYQFTLGEDNETIVEEIQINEEVDYYERIIENVLVGSGVILFAVTVSAATYTVAPAVSFVFAMSAHEACTVALSTATISGIISFIAQHYEDGNALQSLDEILVDASEGFKWGAIIGAVTGAVAGTAGLLRWQNALPEDSLLTLNDIAVIQRESLYPLEIVQNVHSMEEYEFYRELGLTPQRVGNNGRWVLTRQIDWNFVDDLGRTNAERVMQGLAPLDENGIAYELHHVGQMNNSPWAILSRSEHDSSFLHFREASDVDHSGTWASTRKWVYQYLLSFQDPALYASLA